MITILILILKSFVNTGPDVVECKLFILHWSFTLRTTACTFVLYNYFQCKWVLAEGTTSLLRPPLLVLRMAWTVELYCTRNTKPLVLHIYILYFTFLLQRILNGVTQTWNEQYNKEKNEKEKRSRAWITGNISYTYKEIRRWDGGKGS